MSGQRMTHVRSNTPLPTRLVACKLKGERHIRWMFICLLAFNLSMPGFSLAASDDTNIAENIDNPLLGLSATEIAKAYGNQQTYTITRNGKKIGTHTIKFQAKNDELTVTIDSSLSVRILRIPVYRLSYTSTEYWRNNQLVAVTATTTENGKSNTVSLNNTNIDQADAPVPYASNHWNPGVLTGNRVFNTLTGKIDTVSVVALGLEQVKTSSELVSAKHYKYKDDIHVDVWYDEAGLWFMMEFKADDDSDITYQRNDQP